VRRAIVTGLIALIGGGFAAPPASAYRGIGGAWFPDSRVSTAYDAALLARWKVATDQGTPVGRWSAECHLRDEVVGRQGRVQRYRCLTRYWFRNVRAGGTAGLQCYAIDWLVREESWESEVLRFGSEAPWACRD
jgi:hypothetical protein